MPKWRNDKPRLHHYEFAHRAFPGIAFNPRVDLAALANAGHLDGALRATWAAVGERRDEADRLPDDGLQGELVEVSGEPAVLVTFPAADHAAEAFYAVIAPLDPPESRRGPGARTTEPMNHHLLVPLMARAVLSWAHLVRTRRPSA